MISLHWRIPIKRTSSHELGDLRPVTGTIKCKRINQVPGETPSARISRAKLQSPHPHCKEGTL